MKLVEVMACVDRVAKNGNNTQQNYRYAMAADVYEAVRGELAQRFVIPIPNMLKADFHEKPTKAGGSMTYCTATVRYDFTDAETGEVMSSTIIGAGSDSGDKSVYKAMTGATKACLVNTFLIPTGDDPENEKGVKPTPPPPAGLQALKARAQGAAPNIAAAAQRAANGHATHDRSLVYPFGSSKGFAIGALKPDGNYAVDEKSLAFWLQRCNEELADASKAKWHDNARKRIATLEAEQRYRQSGPPASPPQSAPYVSDAEEPPPIDEMYAPPF